MQAGAAIVAVGLALIAIVLVRLLLRRVMLPMDDLSAAVGQLGREPGRVRVARQRYIEFQRLASAFDNMAERIHESQDEITRRNAELTAAIDDLQRAQLQLVQHEKLSAMGEMLAGLAHELNNPLAGILGLGECAKAELLASNDPKAHEIADQMLEPLVQESLRARDLVRNLLQFARASAPQPEPVRLEDAIEVALGLRRHAFAQAGFAIDVDVPPELYVLAQPQKLEHVFINIMNNALDAMRGGKGARFSIHARAEGDDVVLAFTDDGPGFEQPDRVFDPFYTTKRVGEGTGLGLALVHRFVEEVGGTIAAENAPGGGARLTLRFVAANALSGIGGAPPARKTPTPSQPVATVPATRERVLLVDDEPALREVQRRLLSRLSLDVESVASAAEACAAIQARSFDLVVTDLRMPGTMTGRDLIAWLEREAPALARNVVIVTGDLSAAQPDGGLPVPHDRVLCKPFGRAEYIDVVTRALTLARTANVQHHTAA